MGNDDARGRLSRWQLRFAEFGFKVKYVPSKTNVVVDGLSRISSLVTRTATNYELELLAMTIVNALEPSKDPIFMSTIQIDQYAKWAKSQWY